MPPHARHRTIIVSHNLIAKRTAATRTIVLPLPGTAPDQVLAETAGFTEAQRGAVPGRSQSWVSLRPAD